MTGTVTVFPATDSDQDTDLQVMVALNGNTPTTLDAGAPPGTPVTFACNAGDTYSIVQVDFNSVGPSIASVPLQGTVALSPPTQPPGQPGQPQVSFTP